MLHDVVRGLPLELSDVEGELIRFAALPLPFPWFPLPLPLLPKKAKSSDDGSSIVKFAKLLRMLLVMLGLWKGSRMFDMKLLPFRPLPFVVPLLEDNFILYAANY